MCAASLLQQLSTFLGCKHTPCSELGSVVCCTVNQLVLCSKVLLQGPMRAVCIDLFVCLQVTNHDGALWWRQKEAGKYDRVLVDAPCSSDRHVVQQALRNSRACAISSADWSAQQCAKLAALQVRLVAWPSQCKHRCIARVTLCRCHQALQHRRLGLCWCR